MNNPDCIFCKIVRGEIPATKIYEDEQAVAFLDIHPINLGHALVVPKKHQPTFLETPAEELKSLIPIVQKVAKAVKSGSRADGVNISINNDRAAGQLVFHTHFHIIPRYVDDGLKHWGQRQYNNGEIEKVAANIKTALSEK